MSTDDFAERVAGVAALDEPVRRALYLYVAAQPGPVSRDEAAEGVGVARHAAKFHLDRLEQEGLLVSQFRRLTGRQGPGAGRPAKLYARSGRPIEVSLPERRYDVAGRLMAQAIDDSVRSGSPVVESLHAAAAGLGSTLGQQALEAGADDGDSVVAACRALGSAGYEPRCEGRRITLVNCPFDALAREHLELVCGMNLALLAAVADRVGGARLSARLDPAPGRCCVVLEGR